MNYKTYTVDDFVMDESFRHWVLDNDPNVETFWNSWLEMNPEKTEEIHKARELILFIAHEKDLSRKQDESEVWHKINASLPQAEIHDQKRVFMVRWYHVAATVSLLMLSVLAYWTLSPQDGNTYYTTAYGETLNVMLPDSSVVTLNAHSSLKLADDLMQDDSDREVWLQGEGFFEVSHQNGKKFIVHTKFASVEVLGTEFNVSERRGETEVVLNSGKVALHLDKEKVMMEPGEQVIYSSEKKRYKKKVVNTERYTSWRNNILVFEGTPIDEIAQLIEDNYGYQVNIENKEIGKRLFSGTIGVDQIDLLLEAIAEAHDIKITKQKGMIYFRSGQ